MPISVADRLAIHELIGLHGHLVDDRDFSRLAELLTDDVIYDLRDFGGGVHEGLTAFRALAEAPNPRNPLGHHVTNIVVGDESDEGGVRVVSKGIAVLADGRTGSVVYRDVVVRTEAGWRIARRVIGARRAETPDQAAGGRG